MEGMDVDLDPELMQKFSCLGTTDKDVLISEFQRLLGFQLNPAGCAFFLDMTNCLVFESLRDDFSHIRDSRWACGLSSSIIGAPEVREASCGSE
ncbi:protein ILRUN [Leptonychotes weddellii]|uniref:Protein ILRUN n=1 Tax=Leptonychotes weddellii TaxID=9713 RepID=A0A7F8R3C4_LEPWE|nr:protein ILRUN [Leptonychotes weddellii]